MKDSITTSNVQSAPLEITLASVASAIGKLQAVDVVKKITMPECILKDIEKFAVYKDDACKENKFSGIPFVVSKWMPTDVLLIEHASGKKVILNLTTGKSAEIPAPQPYEFEFPNRERTFYGKF